MLKLNNIKFFTIIGFSLWALTAFSRLVYSQPSNEVIVNQMLNQFESSPTNSLSESNSQIATPEDISLSLAGKKISLEADHMDLMQAVNQIALDSGVSIEGQELLTGKLTIYLKDVELLDALRLILDQADLSFIVTASENSLSQALIKIVTPKEFESQNGYGFDQNLATRIIFVKYLKLEDIKEKLLSIKSSLGKIFFDDIHKMVAIIDQPQRVLIFENYFKTKDVGLISKTFDFHYVQGANVISSIESMLTKDVGLAELSENSNSVTVTDTESRVKDIEKFVKDLDQQNKQVVISAKVIQITLNQEHQEGIDWEAILSDYQAIPFEGFELPTTETIKKSLSLGSVNQEDLNVLLDALDTVGIPNVISDSKLTVNFNEEFDIGIDSKDLILMSEADKQNSQEEQKRSIKFDLYTFLSKDDLLSLKIKPNLVIDDKSSPGVNEFKVDIKDGESVIIGGLFKNVTIESTRKIPLLGDLPFLGFVFRNQGQRELRTETVLFLTLKTINKEDLVKNDKVLSND